jgi:hypothetical protein
MSLLCQEQNDLPEIVPDEALIGVSRQTPEWESDQFLQQKEVFLFVGVELVEWIQLI